LGAPVWSAVRKCVPTSLQRKKRLANLTTVSKSWRKEKQKKKKPEVKDGVSHPVRIASSLLSNTDSNTQFASTVNIGSQLLHKDAKKHARQF